jgi:N-methylhydantoinase B/oxoprolinase/acetone carboxylase alpha subunit
MEAPQGFFGGHDGLPGAIVKNPGTPEEESWPSKISGASVKAGELIRIVTPSGGGYYDPFERDPQAVLEDVLDGYTDIKGAEKDYGVKIDPSKMTVDLEATEKLRAGKLNK